MASPRELTREAVLDAARDLLDGTPWSQVSMAAVGHAAGVSRQTVYNELGSREALGAALVLREVDRFLAEVDAAVRAHAPDAPAALQAALAVVLAGIEDDPVVRAVVRGEPGAEELSALVTTQGGTVVGHAVEHLAGVVGELWPDVAATEVRVLAEAVVRLALSLATSPPDDPALTRAITGVLVPYVERVTGAAEPA